MNRHATKKELLAIVAELKRVKKRLPTKRNFGARAFMQSRHICGHTSTATTAGANVRQLVSKALGHYAYFTSWFVANNHNLFHDADLAYETYDFQPHRHAWLDQLIADYTALANYPELSLR